MGLFEDLERVRLQFISTCEALLNKGELSEDNFQQILELLDAMDGYDEEQLNRKLNELTDGKLELMFWDQEIFPGK